MFPGCFPGTWATKSGNVYTSFLNECDSSALIESGLYPNRSHVVLVHLCPIAGIRIHGLSFLGGAPWLSVDNSSVEGYIQMRRKHPKKEVERALDYAERHGWRVGVGGSHCWGKLYCPANDMKCRCGEFCRVSIWGTPRNPGTYARQIRRVVDNCTGDSDWIDE